MSEPLPILHHYGYSPFSEKIRLAFGLKRLRWLSVIQPAVMPKPDLVALTGGYRHIPVLQIGADIYCDTRRIARELDRRWPSPPLQDERTRGHAIAIEAWAERDLFWPLARYVTGVNAETVEPGLHADRAALRGKPAPSIDRVRAASRRSLAELRPQLPVVEAMLAPDRRFLLGEAPGEADLAVYHGLWFLGAFPIDCAGELAAYPLTRAWMARIAALGHGTREELSAAEALAIAARSAPEPPPASIEDDALPRPGARIAVRPEGYATEAVEGTLVSVGRDALALHRIDPALGEITVHFPRAGYSVKEI